MARHTINASVRATISNIGLAGIAIVVVGLYCADAPLWLWPCVFVACYTSAIWGASRLDPGLRDDG